jgi:(S)-3,5-dihydroxyphenylglycine transaminase
MVADQHVEGGGVVAEALSKVKSFVSVLTSPITQAAVGGLLVENEFSLRPHCAEKVAECGRRRAHLLGRLEQAFAANVVAPIRWNRPSGGFFVVVTLPFEFGRRELVECARDYGVIVCPMSFFALGGGFRNQVRLAFSNVSPDQIDAGVERFHGYVRDVSARRLDAHSSIGERELSNA